MKFKLLSIVALAAALTLAAAHADRGSSAAPTKPNIVFVLTDDLAWNLVRYMPHVRELQREGVTFSRFFVSDSLCCPSRATIFTGKYPHDTRIFTNGGRLGGFRRFHRSGQEKDTFATRLHAAGYLTAMMGKYLNQYYPTGKVGGKRAYVPPGWDEWDVGGQAYANFDYRLNENHRIVHYGRAPDDYLTDVLAGRGVAFVERAVRAHRPFFLELATFAPHSPYTAAPRHAHLFPHLRAPRTPAFNERNLSDKPTWLKKYAPLRRHKVYSMDEDFRKRVQAVQAVDEMIGRLENVLRARGQLANTYIVFTSDNGYHIGEHRLGPGKQTAFETDIHIPLIVAGPGVFVGKHIGRLGSTVDLNPTFVELGGGIVSSTVDGRSLVPLLTGEPVDDWRKAVLIEHKGPDVTKSDPDFPGPVSGNPTSYKAIRLKSSVYVEYANGDREFYNLKKDRYELSNRARSLRPRVRKTLHRRVRALVRCHGPVECWTAAGGRSYAIPSRAQPRLQP